MPSNEAAIGFLAWRSSVFTACSIFRRIVSVVWSESSDYRQLLQADYLFLNDRLAKLYGARGSTTQMAANP